MTAQLKHLEELFPNLVAVGYSPKSEQSRVYNCIAYAAGDESRRWEGFREGGYHWPDGAQEGHSLEALVSAFHALGYSPCENSGLEPDSEKVVIYVDDNGLWSHAAKQCDDGQWTSKLGSLEDIIHRTPEALTGPDPAYGSVACFMSRKKKGPP